MPFASFWCDLIGHNLIGCNKNYSSYPKGE